LSRVASRDASGNACKGRGNISYGTAVVDIDIREIINKLAEWRR
jgi:hypothetical protein